VHTQVVIRSRVAAALHLLDTAEASTAYGRFTALTLADAHDKTARFISFPSLPSESDAGPGVEEPEGRRARGVAAAKTTSYKARRRAGCRSTTTIYSLPWRSARVSSCMDGGGLTGRWKETGSENKARERGSVWFSFFLTSFSENLAAGRIWL
jgi:hypothetical protein